MTRIQPKPSTIKQLFALSGNVCAFPECKVKLVEHDIILGEICHVESAEENGPRYNSNSNDEYRRSFPNLILLCERCHKKIDSDIELYSAPLLKSWKDQHENNFKNNNFSLSDELVGKLIEKFMQLKNFNTGSGLQVNTQAKTQNIGTQIVAQNITIDTGYQGNSMPGTRRVNPELKNIIDKHIREASPPTTWVIDYQNELIERTPRPVYFIETRLLNFRKQNGRIKTDVISYEKINKVELKEEDELTQTLLSKFLADNDPEKKTILKKQLFHKGQQQPAIITCDGFLVNGNRRKMAFEELYEENNQDSRFEKMRVVILEEGVTELNIRKIENRYQLQDEGKSEYQGLNRALTIIDNIKIGYDLRAQLRDDPAHTDKKGKEFETIVKKYEKDYIHPLKCSERYINFFNKPDLYKSITESTGDKEGRWEAFKDYSKFYYGTLKSNQQRMKNNIQETDIGKIEDFAFKIIRKRDLRGLSKLHMFLRPPNMKRYLKNQSAKNFLFKIVDEVGIDIADKEKHNKEGQRISESDIDKKWGKHFENQIIGNLMKAKKEVENQIESDQPLDLLEDCLKKLNHRNLQIDNIRKEDCNSALRLTNKISQKALNIHKQVDDARYKLSKNNN